ncbi:uncharacterized protein LOC115170870 [Salmo trutta]|uniref:uncharacterized protein LOC115170870 n=1 Tax=Salmo trutta TaxID=8032 RepID=UPI0011303319|nr:uncharacterized protein LOC115170870 [Salmo trutta]
MDNDKRDGRPEIEMLHMERQRKKRFNEEELKILMREVQARRPGPGYTRVAQAAWEDIASKVSASSFGYLRTGMQCKKRYNDLIRRQPCYIKKGPGSKRKRVTGQTEAKLHHPTEEEEPFLSVQTKRFTFEFVDGEGPIALQEFQNEVCSQCIGVELDSPSTNHLVDGQQTLDAAAPSEASRVQTHTPATSPRTSLPQTNLQPRVNVVRLNLGTGPQVSTPQVTGTVHIPQSQDSLQLQTNTHPVTVQLQADGLPQGNAPFHVNIPQVVPLPQQATLPPANLSQAYIPQANQSQAYMSQSTVQPQTNIPQVNQATVHIPLIEVQPHMQVQLPPQDLAALVQVHRQGYDMLQRELVSMRSSMERVLQPLLSSINNNLERLVNAVEHLSGVESTPQTNSVVRGHHDAPS